MDEEFLDAYPYPYGTYGYAVGAPPPAPSTLDVGIADLLAKLAVMGLAVAGVAITYGIVKKMSKSEKSTRRQASRSAMRAISKAAEKQSARAVDAASERLGEYLTGRRLASRVPIRVKSEILNET